jgi:hypothetical protein
MYRSNNPQYTTPIEELPDLEELERPMQQHPMRMNRKLDIVPNSEKYEKFLRNNYTPPDESGMNYREQPQEMYMPNMPNMSMGYIDQQPQYKEMLYDGRGEPSCIQIANHISNCPICIKFYNNDKTLYILAIVILAIFCILLIKKVLNI